MRAWNVARLRQRMVGLATLLALTWTAVGCGPVQSTQRLSEAEVALERARVARADQRAPYEYYSAKFYLHKAKEEWGYSDFEASHDYATDAKRAAEAALLKAKEDPWEGSPADESITPEDMKDLGVRLDMSQDAEADEADAVAPTVD